jgi:hypothetical protein
MPACDFVYWDTFTGLKKSGARQLCPGISDIDA